MLFAYPFQRIVERELRSTQWPGLSMERMSELMQLCFDKNSSFGLVLPTVQLIRNTINGTEEVKSFRLGERRQFSLELSKPPDSVVVDQESFARNTCAANATAYSQHTAAVFASKLPIMVVSSSPSDGSPAKPEDGTGATNTAGSPTGGPTISRSAPD